MALNGLETVTIETIRISGETQPIAAIGSSKKVKNFKTMIRTNIIAGPLIQRLQRMSATLRNPKQFLEGVVEIVEKAKDRQFDTEGQETETARAWPELAASTIIDRVKKGFAPGPILQRTGRLKKDWEKIYAGNVGALKSRTPYVNTHQYGEWIVPQRKIGEFKARDREKIMNLLKNILFS